MYRKDPSSSHAADISCQYYVQSWYNLKGPSNACMLLESSTTEVVTLLGVDECQPFQRRRRHGRAQTSLQLQLTDERMMAGIFGKIHRLHKGLICSLANRVSDTNQ